MSGDLHCHTKLSDGSIGIEELIALAAKMKVDTISITDHDCMAANVRGRIIGERNGVRVIPGVEITSTDTDTGKEIHILAYYCEFPDRIEGLCHKNSLIRKKAGQYMMLKAASKMSIPNDFAIKCATGSTNLYKQHIMHALMQSGFATSIYGELHDRLFSADSRENILVSPQYTPVQEVIEAVHSADGIAVLAHPFMNGEFELADKLVGFGIDGIEVWHPMHTAEDIGVLTAYAKAHKLLMTGGSDFHGMYNRTPLTVGQCDLPDSCVDDLVNFKSRRRRQQKKIESAIEDKT